MQHQIDTYKKLLGLENSNFTKIKHDDAIVAIVYKIEKANNAPMILKVFDRQADYLRELYFLNKFNKHFPTAKFINSVEPSSKVHGAILMDYLDGALLQSSALTESLAYEIGSLLASIHLHRTTEYGDVITTESLGATPIKHFSFKFNEGLAECKDNLPSNVLKKCREYYDNNVHLLLATDGPCIIHRDFRPGNIIIKDNKVQGIIDWASARSGFAEDDFCPMELGEWSSNAANKTAFLAGYSSIRPAPKYETVMPLLLLNRAIATIGFTVKRGTWNNTSSHLYQRNKNFLNDFFERKI